MGESASPWEFAGWLQNCCRDAPAKLGMDEKTMALYTVNQSIELLEAVVARGEARAGLKLALLQLLQVKAALIAEVCGD